MGSFLVRPARTLVMTATAVFAAVPPAAGDFGDVVAVLRAPLDRRHRQPPPPAPADACAELAARIAWLDDQLAIHGTIVAKEPDVWSQRRLLRHRYEYEAQLERQLGEFSERSSAALRRSDQAFLGMALALQAASGRRRAATDVAVPEVTTSNNVITTIEGLLPSTNEQAGRADSAVVARTAPLAFPAPPAGFGFGDEPVALEPTVHVDQLSRYLLHLQALRRINEGDDSADAPGYDLTLVRIPVSVEPGQRNRRGHAAEITIAATPVLGHALLPTAFRKLVINDLVDVIAPALTWCVNDPECVAWAALIAAGDPGGPADRPGVAAAVEALSARLPSAAPSPAPAVKTRRSRMPIPFTQLAEVSGARQVAILIRDTRAALAAHTADGPCITCAEVHGHVAEELEAAWDFLAREELRDVWAELPAWNLAGLVRGRRTAELAALRCRFLGRLDPAWAAGGLSHGPVAGGPGAGGWMEPPPLPLVLELPADRAGDDRCCGDDPRITPVCATSTAVLAWGILLESAVLDERLRHDMLESRDTHDLAGPDGCVVGPLYGPDPAPEARLAFNDYVRRRWPIRVFALDPVREAQNVDDSFSRRREMQIAMALATAGGRLNAQALARYTRRLETDLATVALNQTAVAFAHGPDTFGWRFYPRVQSPPTRGTLATLGETLRGGPTSDGDLRQRQLEPGMRECTAIIVMPSFIPSITFDVSTRFFSLTHPRRVEPTIHRTLEFARAVEAMREVHARGLATARCGHPAACARMQREVDRLDRRLPLQTLTARTPFENTSGGFELFTTGLSDLGPELMGWYGGPGIDPDATTTLFLIGRGFSVHDTHVIAGGRQATFDLVSREVLRVEIPPGVQTSRRGDGGGCVARARGPRAGGGVVVVAAVEPLPAPPGMAPVAPGQALPDPFPAGDCDCAGCNRREAVDLHLATPYGVSRPLFVPVVRRGTAGDLVRPVFARACEIRLTFTTARASGAQQLQSRVDEFFTSSCDGIVIDVPASFIPPARAEIGLVLRDATTGETAAVLAFPNPFFDAPRSRYLVSAGDLRNFVGDTSRPATDKTLRGAVKPWLDALLAQGRLAEDGDTTTLGVTATILAGQREVPIDGGLRITCTRRGRGPTAATE
jgi:hypothetical protein